MTPSLSKFWTETATHLIDVDVGSKAYVEVPDCEALNSVLVEENMHPSDPDAGNFRRPFLLTKARYAVSSSPSLPVARSLS